MCLIIDIIEYTLIKKVQNCHWGGTLSKGINRYTLGTNSYHLGVNKVQKCLFNRLYLLSS